MALTILNQENDTLISYKLKATLHALTYEYSKSSFVLMDRKNITHKEAS